MIPILLTNVISLTNLTNLTNVRYVCINLIKRSIYERTCGYTQKKHLFIAKSAEENSFGNPRLSNILQIVITVTRIKTITVAEGWFN